MRNEIIEKIEDLIIGKGANGYLIEAPEIIVLTDLMNDLSRCRIVDSHTLHNSIEIIVEMKICENKDLDWPSFVMQDHCSKHFYDLLCVIRNMAESKRN